MSTGRSPALDKVTLHILPSDPVRTAALLSGQLDAVEHVPTADLARLRRNPAFRLEQWYRGARFSCMSISIAISLRAFFPNRARRLHKTRFKDIRVRRAMSKAINRQAIAERVMEGLALPAANVVSPSVFGHDPEVKPEPYDPQGAKKLLAEAGYPDGFAVTLATPNNRYVNDEQVAQAVAQMFSRIGIATKVEAMPLSAYFGKARNREFGVALLGWVRLPPISRCVRSPARPIRTRATAPGTGRLCQSQARCPHSTSARHGGLGKRETLARSASALAAREVAFIPLHYQVVTWAMKKSIAYGARTDEFTFAHHFQAAMNRSCVMGNG